jgi:hypothetical protein
MATGRSQPSLVMDVQVLVTHADRVTTMEREMGHPPRMIRGPDLCDLFQARDAARLPGLVDRWASSGIAAQVVMIPPPEGLSIRARHPTPASREAPAGRDTSHRRDTHECTHRPCPRGTRPDRTSLTRGTRIRGADVRLARDGGLL